MRLELSVTGWTEEPDTCSLMDGFIAQIACSWLIHPLANNGIQRRDKLILKGRYVFFTITAFLPAWRPLVSTTTLLGFRNLAISCGWMFGVEWIPGSLTCCWQLWARFTAPIGGLCVAQHTLTDRDVRIHRRPSRPTSVPTMFAIAYIKDGTSDAFKCTLAPQ